MVVRAEGWRRICSRIGELFTARLHPGKGQRVADYAVQALSYCNVSRPRGSLVRGSGATFAPSRGRVYRFLGCIDRSLRRDLLG